MFEYKLVIADEGRVNQAELWAWLEEQCIQGFTRVDGEGVYEGVTEPVRVYYFSSMLDIPYVAAFAAKVRDAFRQKSVYLVQVGEALLV